MLQRDDVFRWTGSPDSVPIQGEGDYGGGGGIIGALAGAGALIYDSWNDARTARQNTDKTIAANKREAELAYQREMEMWNLQNAYNTPEAQMARFTAGGLNPHLIYGQGNSGNAASIPKYQPADQQYRYEAPNYGSALTTILPTLMQVGTWMQGMRLSEAEIDSKVTGTERSRQMIDYLIEKNPQLLQEGKNRLSLFPYQKDAQRFNTFQAETKLAEMQQDFRQKYGEDLFGWLPQHKGSPRGDIGGTKRLEFLQEQSKTKLAEAKASWSEFDITDPQALMMMVLQSVMGMAGAQLRAKPSLSTKGRSIHEVEEQMRTGRKVIRRRIYEK